jgi:hypothetical protein
MRGTITSRPQTCLSMPISGASVPGPSMTTVESGL